MFEDQQEKCKKQTELSVQHSTATIPSTCLPVQHHSALLKVLGTLLSKLVPPIELSRQYVVNTPSTPQGRNVLDKFWSGEAVHAGHPLDVCRELHRGNEELAGS